MHVPCGGLKVPDSGLFMPGEVCQKKCLSHVDCTELSPTFIAGINDCLNRVATEYKNKRTIFMPPNFQNLENNNLLAL
jgi:hypothetical protein